MRTETFSPNMNLVLPTPGVTPGPDYATDLISSLSILDSHNHSAGSGVQITPAGLDISADLSFQGNNATLLRSTQYSSRSAVITDLLSFYVVNGDAYYNDSAGNKIRLTQSGSIAGTTGSISGLTSPASATYISASTKFVWQSDANISADMDFGSAILRNNTASSFGLTLAPPTLSANYTLTLPTIPSATKIMTMNTAGAMSAAYSLDNSTIEVSSNVLRVKAAGITSNELATGAVATANLAALSVTTAKIALLAVDTAQLAASAVTTSKVADGAITAAKKAAVNAATASISTFSTTSTGLISTGLATGVITNTRPVVIYVQPDGGFSSIDGGTGGIQLAIDRSGTILAYFNLPAGNQPATGWAYYLDTVFGAAVYTIVARSLDGSVVQFNGFKIAVVEQ